VDDEPGDREVSALLRAQDAPTTPVPRLTMREQLEQDLWDRKLRAVRAAERARR
jgi:hypothetical protein